MNVLAISGSLRKGSYNSALLRAAQELASKDMNITIFDIATLPLYNQDFDEEYPASAQALKDAVEASDALIIATPEFNRSLSGSLKNALDIGSRPSGKNSFSGKPVLVVGASVGAIGTAVAQQHLKQILLFLNMKVIGQPEFYLGSASQKFDEDGNLTDEKTREYLAKALVILKEHIVI